MEIVGHKSLPLESSKDRAPCWHYWLKGNSIGFKDTGLSLKFGDRFPNSAKWTLMELSEKREPTWIKCPQSQPCVSFNLTVSPERWACVFPFTWMRKLRPRDKSNLSRVVQPGVVRTQGCQVGEEHHQCHTPDSAFSGPFGTQGFPVSRAHGT